MTRYFLALLLAATVRQVLADDIAPVPVPQPTALATPVYSVTPATAVTAANGPYAAQAPADASPYQDKLSKSDHLLQAARELEAAGLSDEAARFRQLAAKEKASAPQVQVIVELHMMKLSLANLGETNAERYGGGRDMTVLQYLDKLQPPPSANIHAKDLAAVKGEKLWALLNSLRKEGMVTLLSEPNLVTQVGRPAYIRVGGEIGYPTTDVQGNKITAYKEYGTRADVVVNRASADRINLDLRLCVTQLFAGNSARAGEKSIPVLDTTECEGALDVRPGEMVLLGDVMQDRSEPVAPLGAADARSDRKDGRSAPAIGERSQFFFFVKADIVPKPD